MGIICFMPSLTRTGSDIHEESDITSTVYEIDENRLSVLRILFTPRVENVKHESAS